MKRKAMIFFTSLFVVIIVTLLVDTFIIPIKKVELRILHSFYLKGSGYDDGVAEIIGSHQKRYAEQLRTILLNSSPDSDDEQMALSFIEYVIKQKKIKETLKAFGSNHPNKKTRCLVEYMLDESPKLSQTPISHVYVVIKPDIDCGFF